MLFLFLIGNSYLKGFLEYNGNSQPITELMSTNYTMLPVSTRKALIYHDDFEDVSKNKKGKRNKK